MTCLPFFQLHSQTTAQALPARTEPGDDVMMLDGAAVFPTNASHLQLLQIVRQETGDSAKAECLSRGMLALQMTYEPKELQRIGFMIAQQCFNPSIFCPFSQMPLTHAISEYLVPSPHSNFTAHLSNVFMGFVLMMLLSLCSWCTCWLLKSELLKTKVIWIPIVLLVLWSCLKSLTLDHVQINDWREAQFWCKLGKE